MLRLVLSQKLVQYQVERRVAARVRSYELRGARSFIHHLVLQQCRGCWQAATLSGKVQRQPPACIARASVGAVRKQEMHQGQLAVRNGLVQSCPVQPARAAQKFTFARHVALDNFGLVYDVVTMAVAGPEDRVLAEPAMTISRALCLNIDSAPIIDRIDIEWALHDLGRPRQQCSGLLKSASAARVEQLLPGRQCAAALAVVATFGAAAVRGIALCSVTKAPVTVRERRGRGLAGLSLVVCRRHYVQNNISLIFAFRVG